MEGVKAQRCNFSRRKSAFVPSTHATINKFLEARESWFIQHNYFVEIALISFIFLFEQKVWVENFYDCVISVIISVEENQLPGSLSVWNKSEGLFELLSDRSIFNNLSIEVILKEKERFNSVGIVTNIVQDFQLLKLLIEFHVALYCLLNCLYSHTIVKNVPLKPK